MLTGFILLGIFATFAVSKLLSVTVLKGVPPPLPLSFLRTGGPRSAG